MILTPAIFALAHAYMGATLPGNIYPKYGRDIIAYAVMTLWMAFLLMDWRAVAYLPAFWLLFSASPGKRFPWTGKRPWFPNGYREPVRETLLTLALRYGGLYCLPLAAVNAWLISPVAGAVTVPAMGLLMAAGYWIGTKWGDKGDTEGKLTSGALMGLFMAIIAGDSWI